MMRLWCVKISCAGLSAASHPRRHRAGEPKREESHKRGVAFGEDEIFGQVAAEGVLVRGR